MSQNNSLNESFEYEENESGRTTPTYKRKRRGELSKEERPKHREQKYRPEWELKPSYKDWLRKVEGDNMKAKCIKCNTTFVSELVVIKNHALGKKHKINIANTPKKTSAAMLNFIKDGNKKDPLEDKIKIAEIKLCALIVEHNIAFNCIDHIVGVLKNIFDDSEICQKIQLKRTKATNVIKNVISPFAKQLLATKLKFSKFSVMIDESTDVGCESTMCVIVRFHDAEEQRIVSRFWSLIQVYDKKNIDKVNEGATANNLFNSCIQTFEEYKIPFTNIIGFGSDGCNSMFGVRNSVASRMQNVFPGIFLMKCICHSLHLVSSEACKELPKRCEDLARQIHSYFSQSSKRQSQFHQFQVFLKVKEHKILHPSATRWLSMSSVVSRIIEQWDALKLYFNDQWLSEKLLSSKTIYDQLNDPFTKAFYLFLEWVLPKFVLLNKYFQSDKVVLDVLHEKMVLTYKDILLTFMKRDYIMKTPLPDIDPNDKTKYLKPNEIYLGIKLTNFLSCELITQRQDLLRYFYDKCQSFLSTSCLQIKKRYNFDDPILSLLSCLSPKIAISSIKRQTWPSLLILMNKVPRIVDKDNINLMQTIDDQWRTLPLNIPQNLNADMDTGTFWNNMYASDEFDNSGFKELAKFALTILSLPHSNAECERLFSKINRTKTKSRNRMITETVSAALMTCECVKNSKFSSKQQQNECNCVTFTPPKAMINLMTTCNLYPIKENQSNEDNDDNEQYSQNLFYSK